MHRFYSPSRLSASVFEIEPGTLPEGLEEPFSESNNFFAEIEDEPPYENSMTRTRSSGIMRDQSHMLDMDVKTPESSEEIHKHKMKISSRHPQASSQIIS